MQKIRELLEEGNVRRIIKDDAGKVYMEIPVTLGLIGALVAPILAAVGALACASSRVSVSIMVPIALS